VAADLQHYVLSRYADRLVTAYLHDEVRHRTTTRFGDSVTVTRNLDTGSVLDTGNDTIAISGVEVVSDDGSVKAGVFTRFNGVPLSTGEHVLVQEREPSVVTIRHPKGGDTEILVAYGNWKRTDQLLGRAFDVFGKALGSVDVRADADGLRFECKALLHDRQVGRYEIVNLSTRRRAVSR
jgi:hypothetical protein